MYFALKYALIPLLPEGNKKKAFSKRKETRSSDTNRSLILAMLLWNDLIYSTEYIAEMLEIFFRHAGTIANFADHSFAGQPCR